MNTSAFVIRWRSFLPWPSACSPRHDSRRVAPARSKVNLHGATMVRNEADIVETFVRHNLTKLDGLLVVDHGSIDGTSQILEALVREGLPLWVERDERPALLQSEIMTRCVRNAFERGADFVFALAPPSLSRQ